VSASYRASDSPRTGRFWIWFRRLDFVWQRFVPLLAILALYLVVVDSTERRDQMCQLFEADHLADVNRLERTYRFLSSPAARDDEALLQVALVELPELEREARVDSAPDFCDEDGLGLPEPDPVVPDRPDLSPLQP
jgi:hypothetical protein